MDIPSYLMGRSSGGKGATIEVVTELPETGESNVIYLVPKQDEDENNVFDEYIWINDDWELIGSTAIDISGKQDTMQFSTMPTADATTVGKIVQYTGTTTNDYTNGYFYIGINNSGTYSWSNINVQSASVSNDYTIMLPDSKMSQFKSLLDASGYYQIVLNNDAPGLAPFLKKMYDNNIDDFTITVFGKYANAMPYNAAKYKSVSFRSRTDGDKLTNKSNLILLETVLMNSSYNCKKYQLSISVSWSSDNIPTTGRIEFNTYLANYLSQNNTTAYTPTGDYNPATKKYVDDSIAAAITTTLGGSF